jgi:hypothetical protein
VECRHNKGEQGWWQTKVVLAMPEMERRPNRGLVEMGQIRPRKKEKLRRLEVPVRWTNVSAQEMVDTSVVQMFPMLNVQSA